MARAKTAKIAKTSKDHAPASGDLARERARIDELDARILELLASRAKVAKAIGAIKRRAGAPSFHDPERERAVLERLARLGAGALPEGAIRAVFREVMSACLSLEEPLRVAYLGPEGTFSQMAARRLFGLQARYRDAATIEAVFEAVASGDASYGVVPFENSTEGAVASTTDALLGGELRIRQELVLPIEHCFLSRARSIGEVATVYSHPQALAQCRAWLAKHAPRAQIVQTPSTAAAAREAREDERAAAIGAAIAAEIHDVPILRSAIQDRRENATRFVVVAKEDAPPSGRDRTTILFGLRDEQGALRKVLSDFEDAGVNLTRIESRPSRTRAWSYAFLVDVDGHRTDPAVAAALAAVARRVDFLSVAGSYPRAAALSGTGPPGRPRAGRARGEPSSRG